MLQSRVNTNIKNSLREIERSQETWHCVVALMAAMAREVSLIEFPMVSRISF
jgi:hypothetical protein